MRLTSSNIIELQIPPSCHDCFGFNKNSCGGVYIFTTDKEYFSTEDIENDILKNEDIFTYCKCIEQIHFQEIDTNSYKVVIIHVNENNSRQLYNEKYKEQTKNIRKAIANSKQSDKNKLNWGGNGKLESVGNITYEYITELLKIQRYKCYICNDNVLTHSYVPFCSYKFSIDRLDNYKPHDIDNVKISCYFCNCKNHILFNKSEKLKCEDKKCECNNI